MELSVSPGSLRRHDVFTYNKFQHIRFILEQEFLPTDELKAHFIEEIASLDEESPCHDRTETPEDIYWQIFCFKLECDLFGGGEIELRVIQVGKIEKVIDLCPYITVHFPNNLSYSLEQRAEFGDELLQTSIVQDILWGALQSHDVVRFSIDWEGIMKQIPPLKEPLLQPGEILALDKDAIDYDKWVSYKVRYGMWDEEDGIPLYPDLFVDPEPLDLSENKQN